MCVGAANRSFRSFCVPPGDINALLAHLSCVCELKGSECSLQVSGVGLEVVESASNVGLQLRRLLTGRAVRRNLVERAHFEFLKFQKSCWCCWLGVESIGTSRVQKGMELFCARRFACEPIN
jgi:hypothetical protein